MSQPVLPVIYVAGPYRAPTAHGVFTNILKAREAALVVWKMGAVAICPHCNAGLFDGEAPDEVWLAGDLELLRRSDAVLMLDGWNASSGASAEHQLATDMGLPIFYDTIGSAMRMWIHNWKRVPVE
jgi:hypothetical protein